MLMNGQGVGMLFIQNGKQNAIEFVLNVRKKNLEANLLN